MSPERARSRLRHNAAANIMGRVVSMVAWIVVTPYILDRLGQERFAVWTLFFLLNGYVISMDFGSGAGASRFVAVAVARNDRSEARFVIRRSLFLGLAIGLLWGLVGILGRGWFNQIFHVPVVWASEVRSSLVVFSVSLVLFAVSQVLLGALVGFQRLDLWNYYYLAGLGVHLGTLVFALSKGYGLVGTAAAAVAGHAVTALLTARSVRSELARLPVSSEPARRSWRDLLNYGVWVQAANFFGTAQFQASKVMLGIIGQLTWVTQFELGFGVANRVWSLSTLIQSAVVPAAAHAAETEGIEGARRMYDWCCRWVILVGAYTLGLVAATAPTLFTLWLGKPHPETAEAARWVAAGLALSTLAGPATTIGRGLGSPWYEAVNFAVALTVNVVGGMLLIPKYGIQGAGIAMTLSFLAATCVLLTLFHRRIGVATGPWLARIALPRLLPAVVAAVAIGAIGARWNPAARSGAFVVTFVEGALFTLIFVAATWHTGDAKAAAGHLRGVLARFGGKPA